MSCALLSEDLKHIFPGWVCCKCRVYNGLQRKECKTCGHVCCNLQKPKPEEFGLCNICGIPLDSEKYKTFYGGPVQHIGHAVAEGSKTKQ